MFHDPRLDRTTDTLGLIREKNWHGDLENARTSGHPIPTFAQTLALLMEVIWMGSYFPIYYSFFLFLGWPSTC